MQALMLAAGMGKRLGKYTNNQTKCMVEVGGKTLFEHTIDALKIAGINKFVVVVGYKGSELIDFANKNISGIEIEFIENPDYNQTNNIYSLFLAKDKLLEDNTILIESDLIFDKYLIKKMVESHERDLAAVAKYEYWMDGTVTLVDKNNHILEFVEKKDFSFESADRYYKTVNIYKFSKEFSEKQYVPFLKAYIEAYGKNQYYELVLKAIAHISNSDLKAYKLKNVNWYEIDDAQDLDIAMALFAKNDDKLSEYNKHFGGFWRFSGLKDFCYLVNPYYPPKEMCDKFKYFFDTLLTEYPSGMYIQKINAERIFGVDENEIIVGNGAAEIINVLGNILDGRMGLPIPAFNEYVRCFKKCEIEPIFTNDNNYRLDKDRIISQIKKLDILTLVNPDNPSGSFIKYSDMMEIIAECNSHGVMCIVDESFVDFVDKEIRYSLLDSKILQKYNNLVIIKSISKSYGVPGLRLGIAATSNKELLSQIKEALPVWNINSFAEYFLQISNLFEKNYKIACDKIGEQRTIFMESLKKISYIEPYSSQANYIMCKLTDKYTSKKLANILIKDFNILIKDLSGKDGFGDGEYIRIAVKSKFDNDYIIEKLKILDK